MLPSHSAILSDAPSWLNRARIKDPARGLANLEKICGAGITTDLLQEIFVQLEETLPIVSDPDMAFNNFERFVAAARSPLALGALFQRDPSAILILLRIFSNSQHLADLLIRDPEAYDALRISEGQPISLPVLIDDLTSEMRSATETRQAMAILRRFKQRETLRIAFGDLIAQQRLALVAEQISFVAQAICQCAYEFCNQQLQKKWGVPCNNNGVEIPLSIFALGKLGGNELNYSSDIDLILVYGENGKCDGPRARSSQEFFEELTRDFTKILSEPSRHGICYRVDLRLRPDGSKGRIVNSRQSLIQYLENKGRTWERQAWIKARVVAGDQILGNSIRKELAPWIYRNHLSRFEISDVKALKRQIEKRAIVDGVDRRDIKTGHGGIRDVEFVIQFLQLLNGGRLASVRTVNTLHAIEMLQLAGCLALNEETLLTQNYIWLRRLEHRLQIMFDLQTHTLPDSDNERQKIAIRMGYADVFDESSLTQFQRDLTDITDINRRILDHLMHGAFTNELDEEVPPIVDLIFKSEPNEAEMLFAFQNSHFSDPIAAAKNFISCSVESIPFLSQHRCRHFFAAIAPKLIKEISETPNPDATLVALRSVSDGLGAKGVLWELFSISPLSMELFVRLCASAEYLVSILRSHPGMVDELVDALLVEDLASKKWLRNSLKDLLRGAQQLDPIIHSFKQAQLLRVGVRDLVGHVSSEQVNQAISNIADVCLEQVADFCFRKMASRLGKPQIKRNETWHECGFAIIACGKLGGHEINYQSDLDLIFVFEGEGQTVGRDAGHTTSNQHFFSEWAAEVIKLLNTAGNFGRLFETDSRLRPSGKSGSLANSLAALQRYFVEGDGQTWERLVLCKSRVVVGNPDMQALTADAIVRCITAKPWDPQQTQEIREMRNRMQQDAGSGNLKRAAGGTVDVEFLTQFIQMKHLTKHPELRRPETVSSLELQAKLNLIETADAETLIANYRVLRSVEGALRLTSAAPRSELGTDDEFLKQVTYLMRRSSCAELKQELEVIKQQNRMLFERYVANPDAS